MSNCDNGNSDSNGNSISITRANGSPSAPLGVQSALVSEFAIEQFVTRFALESSLRMDSE